MYGSDDDSFEDFCAVKRRVRDLHWAPEVAPPKEDRHGRVFDVAMHKWLPWVEDLTFRTVFVDLDRENAAKLLSFMRTRDVVGGKLVEREAPDAEDAAAVKGLADRITQALSMFPGAKGFVKLSTRSPKDSVFDCYSEKTAALVDEELAKLPLSPRDDNAEIGAFFMAANRAMCSNNGEEAIDLFVKSLRIRQDLERALKIVDVWDMCIVCREFLDLPLHSEFRAFVCEGRLTAISQYFWFCYFPVLVERHDAYLDAMVRFFDEQLSKRVPYASYVVDFAVVDDKVWVIELNPFGDVSGACLFNWKEDADLLLGRLSGRPVLRVRLGPMPHARERAIVSLWDKYLLEKRAAATIETPGRSGCC